MSEMFGAVASGAGLLSLAVQLIESSQKLKKLYNASRDAPSAVADLCFELETMSLSLHQLESHRSKDVTGDELLGRCVATCTRMVTKIQQAVSKIESLLQKSRMVGRLYMAFKEPEMNKLLGEMEQAKSSMSFAYMSYCHSWNVGETMKQAAMSSAQNAMLTSHGSRLRDLECSVENGNAAILARLREPLDEPKISLLETTASSTTRKGPRTIARVKELANRSKASLQVSSKAQETTPSKGLRHGPKKHLIGKFRISLPFWFISNVWEFGVKQLENGWEFRIHPVNLRPGNSFVYDVLRSGNVPAFRSLLASKELSVQDQFSDENTTFPGTQNILEIAARHGRIELCHYLLDNYLGFREDAAMYSALKSFLDYAGSIDPVEPENHPRKTRQEADKLYRLFIDDHGMTLLTEKEECSLDFIDETVMSNMLLTNHSVRSILASQLIPFKGCSFDLRFGTAMSSKGWPAKTFLEFLRTDDSLQLATKTDARGRTALHWAAEHMGYWAATRIVRDCALAESQVDSYAELAGELIDMGAHVHMLTHDDQTPLVSFLDIASSSFGFEVCGRALNLWGVTIMDSCYPLDEYVKEEIRIRQALAYRHHKRRPYFAKDSNYDEMQLLVLDDSTLAMELSQCWFINVWDYSPPPGTWNANCHIPQTIIWDPNETEEPEEIAYWRRVERVPIMSAPFVVEYEEEIESMPELTGSRMPWSMHWEELFCHSTQDDTMPIARVLQAQCEQEKEHVERTRRRASSAPSRTIRGESFPCCNTSIATIHKCILDSKWKPFKSGEHSGLRCMQGRCYSPSSHDFEEWEHWESELLRDIDKAGIALRYADRFQPGLRPYFETEYERKRRWAELES